MPFGFAAKVRDLIAATIGTAIISVVNKIPGLDKILSKPPKSLEKLERDAENMRVRFHATWHYVGHDYKVNKRIAEDLERRLARERNQAVTTGSLETLRGMPVTQSKLAMLENVLGLQKMVEDRKEVIRRAEGNEGMPRMVVWAVVILVISYAISKLFP